MNLKGTKWVGHKLEYNIGADTINLLTNSTGYWFSAELDFGFRGNYQVVKDSLIIKYKTAAFEMEDVSDQPYDRIEKYLVSPDSLYLVDLHWRRFGKMVRATDLMQRFNLNKGRLK